MEDGNGKRYGLLCPKKKATLSAPRAINVFGTDQESEDEDGTDWVKKALKAEGEKNRAKRQTRLDIEKALLQDPTVCQYDEVFDDMKRREERTEKKNERAKKPKYIENLLKTAERRKREQEHRIERTVQKEREAEGAAFADKESFVTSAYRAKLEEFKRMEEDGENADRLESIGDVTKQPDISGFYRHLFQQTVNNEKPANDEEKSNPDRDADSTASSGKPDHHRTSPKLDGRQPSPEPDVRRTSPEPDVRRTSPKQEKRVRRYRQRTTQDSESEEETKSDEEPNVTPEETSEPAEKRIKESRIEDDFEAESEKVEKPNITSKIAETDTREVNTKKTDDRKANGEVEKKKVSIWEKRTVGPVFEAALQRYYARKAVRLSGS